jgi:hypothetical protein
MTWLIDGSNLLGRERESDAAKRELVRLLARFARARRTRVTCYFDGPEPPSFAKHLGTVTVVFSGNCPADELIVQRVGNGDTVVTSDRRLAGSVQGRRIKVVEPAAFSAEITSLPADESPADAEDWMAYFSDPKNRGNF